MVRRKKALEVAAGPSGEFHHGKLADAAVHAAFDLVRSGGVECLTLRAVASVCGVDHTALYRHYASKSDLLTAVAARGFQLLLKKLEPHESREPFLEAYARFALGEPQLYAAMFSAEMQANYNHDPLAGPIRKLTHLAAESICGNARDAVILEKRRDAVFRDWALVHGLIDLHARGLIRARTMKEAIAYIRHLVG